MAAAIVSFSFVTFDLDRPTGLIQIPATPLLAEKGNDELAARSPSASLIEVIPLPIAKRRSAGPSSRGSA